MYLHLNFPLGMSQSVCIYLPHILSTYFSLLIKSLKLNAAKPDKIEEPKYSLLPIKNFRSQSYRQTSRSCRQRRRPWILGRRPNFMPRARPWQKKKAANEVSHQVIEGLLIKKKWVRSTIFIDLIWSNPNLQCDLKRGFLSRHWDRPNIESL